MILFIRRGQNNQTTPQNQTVVCKERESLHIHLKAKISQVSANLRCDSLSNNLILQLQSNVLHFLNHTIKFERSIRSFLLVCALSDVISEHITLKTKL